MTTLRQLRAHAVVRSLFEPTRLKTAIDRLGFVQADPIRAPARAQDLILRQRVIGYRAGDLERRYSTLGLDEDLLYAYGFLPRARSALLHPRSQGGLEDLDRRVLEFVREKESHPRELESRFGGGRVVNAWGGYSRATKRALERLHYRGLVRVARRDNGVRVYQATAPRAQTLSPSERVQKLVRLVVSVLAPAPQRTVRAIASRLQRHVPDAGRKRLALDDLLESGELERGVIDGIPYIWPAAETVLDEVPRRVRFLAPFDPVVWDRLRFEHLWRWPYRFEAYTPPKKRVRGYYAMPLLWRDSVVGWANVRGSESALDVEVGFAESRPKERDFAGELDREIADLAFFLQLQKETGA